MASLNICFIAVWIFRNSTTSKTLRKSPRKAAKAAANQSANKQVKAKIEKRKALFPALLSTLSQKKDSMKRFLSDHILFYLQSSKPRIVVDAICDEKVESEAEESEKEEEIILPLQVDEKESHQSQAAKEEEVSFEATPSFESKKDVEPSPQVAADKDIRTNTRRSSYGQIRSSARINNNTEASERRTKNESKTIKETLTWQQRKHRKRKEEEWKADQPKPSRKSYGSIYQDYRERQEINEIPIRPISTTPIPTFLTGISRFVTPPPGFENFTDPAIVYESSSVFSSRRESKTKDQSNKVNKENQPRSIEIQINNRRKDDALDFADYYGASNYNMQSRAKRMSLPGSPKTQWYSPFASGFDLGKGIYDKNKGRENEEPPRSKFDRSSFEDIFKKEEKESSESHFSLFDHNYFNGK